jgi:hypothetical protein
MFFCCGNNQSKDNYQLVYKNPLGETVIQFVQDFKKVDPQLLENSETMVRPIQMSDYREVFRQCRKDRKKFEDISFPPDNRSLGNIGVDGVKWKRIPEFISYPTFFDTRIEPNDVVHKNIGDCYLLSAIAALA